MIESKVYYSYIYKNIHKNNSIISIYSIVSIYNRFLKSSKTREISFNQQQQIILLEMKITRQSILTGVTRTLEINVTQEQIDKWFDGSYIQDIMPNLSADDREFLISGITPDEWNKAFPEEEEDEVEDLRDPNGNS